MGRGALPYYAVQLVGVCGPGGVWGGLHLPGQVARAVQGVCGGPTVQRLLSIEEDQLQGQVRAGCLHERCKGKQVSILRVHTLPPVGIQNALALCLQKWRMAGHL